MRNGLLQATRHRDGQAIPGNGNRVVKEARVSARRVMAFVLLAWSMLAATPIAAHAGDVAPSLCCPSDLNGDGAVGPADLAQLLGGWGGATPDLDGDGVVGASDLAVLLGAWGTCAEAPCLRTRLTGTVVFAGGSPVDGAFVATDQGGEGLTSRDGAFSFEVDVSEETMSLQVIATAIVAGVAFEGSVSTSRLVLGGVTDVGAITVTDGACDGDATWLPMLGQQPGLGGTALALTSARDGAGGADTLYVGGAFTMAGGLPANGIAKWDGAAWTPLGLGLSHSVYAVAMFDDGAGGGPALFAAGQFTMAGGIDAYYIAKWDGAAWSAVGGGLNGAVRALTTFDDGSGHGPSLYAGGQFTMAGGEIANRIARWNGSSWSALGTGMENTVLALATFDDGSGSGPALYAGGAFDTAGGSVVSRIAKWDGATWSSLGDGLNGTVNALTSFDDGRGGGAELFAGGNFTTAGGEEASRIARWNGKTWSGVGGGMNSWVSALAVLDGPSGGVATLCAGGNFTTAGGTPATCIARWDGTAWSALESGLNAAVYALAPVSDDRGVTVLYAGGLFTGAGASTVNSVAVWEGAEWLALGKGLNLPVAALAATDDRKGGDRSLFVGGSFTSVDRVPARRVARWDGSAWSALGAGMNNLVHALATSAVGGEASALYAGGAFTAAGDVMASRIAKWDGDAWSTLGSGMNSQVWALAAFDEQSGSGTALYAGGQFTIAGGIMASRIARWDGASWSALGAGMNDAVYALATFDDGSGAGTALYAGGAFTTAGGVLVNGVAKWDGSSWSPLGSGLNGSVYALATFDDGSGDGPALFAGGSFTIAGGAPASRIAKWDGVAWSPVGSGVNGDVRALAAVDEGNGPVLYAGGDFTAAGGVAVERIAQWNGTSWVTTSSGMNGRVDALATFDDGAGAGPMLYVGGQFSTSAAGDGYLAKRGCDTVAPAAR